MDILEQAKRYLQAVPPAISGQAGHSQTLNAARALAWGFNLPEHQAMELLKEWNQTCQPPWSDHELQHKINEATTKDFGKPRGYLITHRSGRPGRPAPAPHTPPPRPELPKIEYNMLEAEGLDLPKGKRDGFEKILHACFRPGEGVRIMSGMDDEGLIRCDSRGGLVLKQEEWLAKLEEYGSINGMYSRQGGEPVGVYLGCNPMKEDGRGRDEDVTAYRHCLLEFDKIPLRQQWYLITQSEVPCAAVIYSGGKSVHAWVKINAKDKAEYDDRVSQVYGHFAKYQPDTKNKNPARFSRCPDAKRGTTLQMLLATDIGAESFEDWSRHLLVQGIGITHSASEIRLYRPEDDQMTVAGDQWLRKGGSAILVGPSGIGKSSLGRQLALSWSIGRPCFGVTPAKPLKILMIQAENDLADMHKMDIGIYRGLGILEDQAALDLVEENLISNHNYSDTSHNFILSLQRLVDHHRPDLVIADPLLSFIGDDISRQEVTGRFCRNWLNPILANGKVAFLGLHHTGKPPKEYEEKGKKGRRPQRTMADWSYMMMGSSELTNWARAVMILHQLPDNTFELIFSKRGANAGAVHPNGDETQIVLLEHSPKLNGKPNIYWIQKDPVEECVSAAVTAEETLAKLPKFQQVASSNVHDFIAAIPEGGETFASINPRLETFAANVLGIDIHGGTVSRALNALIANHKLAKSGKLYIKGENS